MNTQGSGPGDPTESAAERLAAPVSRLVQTRLHELEGDYEITRELGRGGTAIVYHARDRELGREVAIKLVHHAHINDAEAVERLAREARLIAQLRHPNIVTLYGTRRLSDDSLALIMQYVPGRTLKETVREEGPLPIVTVANVLRDIAVALQYAYQRHGIVHRDIKPENIYVDADADRVLLSDFGIARIAEVESSLTIAGTALGTPAYMSPEQIDGLTLDGRSDLYSLGLVAYEMLSGRQPWAGSNLYAIIYRQKHEELPPLHEFRSDIPLPMRRAVEGLLRKNRDDRWSAAARFIAELRPGAIFGVAPPALTHRPGGKGRPGAEPPSSGVVSTEQTVAADDSPTIVYRPLDALPPADSAVPRIRFFLDGDAEPAEGPAVMAPAAAEATAAVVDDESAVVTRPRRRRLSLAIEATLFVMLAAAMAPFINTDADGGGDAAAVDPSFASPAPAAAVPTPADSSTLMPRPAARDYGAAERLVVLTDNFTGHVGTSLPVPVGILVEDADGRAVPDATVELEIIAGGGRVDRPAAVSDSGGLAMARWTLGELPGLNELSARIAGIDDSRITVRATGIPAPAAQLIAVSGSGQSALGSAVLPEPIVVRAEDAFGNPAAGLRVEFSVRAGGGSVQPTAAFTDSAGVARAVWTIGPDAEAHRLTAAIPQSDIVVEFSAATQYRLSPQARLVAGGTHTCLLSSGGDLRCWGGNENGQLGAGAAERIAGMTAVRAAGPIARVAAGVSHTCALDRAGAPWCWGVNDAGQLGSGDLNDRAAPERVVTRETFVAITAGLAHTCALTAQGRAFCWGDASGTGTGSRSNRFTPEPVAGGHTFTTLSAGWRHTCGLTSENIAYCWGGNQDGQLGDTGRTSNVPVRVAGDVSFTAIVTGAAHSCGVTADGATYCWGQNSSAQLGIGAQSGSSRPLRVQAPEPLVAITAGAVHTCGLARDGQAYCWGSDNFGQLGRGGAGGSSLPVAVAGDLRFASLSAGGSHSCGRTSTGDYYCWGYNVEGQLGDGSRADRTQPVRVLSDAR